MTQVPEFYDPQNAVWGYSPNHQTIFEAANDLRRSGTVKPSSSDRFKVEVLLIDVQKDFVYPEGTLYVGGRSGTGAVDDARRQAEFIYKNLESITRVTPTMDTHLPQQIFFASWWEDEDGNPPAPATIITADDVRKGRWRPSPHTAQFYSNSYGKVTEYALWYVERLEEGGKYPLMVWPFHCILGSDGHALAGIIEEARTYQAWARGVQSMPEVKGGNPLTENYSVFGPEVTETQDAVDIGQRNVAMLEKLMRNDAVVIAGQASSHCVRASIDDLLGWIKQEDELLAQKVYIVEDMMSPVAIPDGQGGFAVDFTDEAEQALRGFEQAGMNLVQSTTDLRDWPGMKID